MNGTLKKVAVAAALLVTIGAGFAQAQSQFFLSGNVAANGTHVWTVWVPSGGSRIVINGGTHTDLDLRIYDNRTRQVLAEDLDHTSYCIGQVYSQTGRWVDVEVSNLGRSSNAYTLSVAY
jgi:hypothetical protein